MSVNCADCGIDHKANSCITEEKETYETYSFKCPHCGVFQDPSDYREDVEEEEMDCERCEERFIATSRTGTTYSATALVKKEQSS